MNISSLISEDDGKSLSLGRIMCWIIFIWINIYLYKGYTLIGTAALGFILPTGLIEIFLFTLGYNLGKKAAPILKEWKSAANK